MNTKQLIILARQYLVGTCFQLGHHVKLNQSVIHYKNSHGNYDYILISELKRRFKAC